MPSNVLTRTGTMLRLVQQGLRDMESPEQDRILLGFFSIAVFGRSVTSALQNLRTFDKQAFNNWYAGWQEEMKADPLCQFFYQLRSEILKEINPLVGVVLAAAGQDAPRLGAVTIPGRPSPTMHRGQAIEDTSMINLCRLYVT